MRRWGLLVLSLFTAAGASAGFDRPSEKEQLRALGDLFEEADTLHRLLTPDGDFRPVRLPDANDWLGQHAEAGQTFDAYRESDAHRPDATRRIIYLLPIGNFPEETSPPLEEMRAYAADFFQMEVKLLPAYLPHDLEFSPRKNPRSGQRQVLSTAVMSFLKTRLPPDGYCLLGVTMEDLYPQPSWNYVFGQASLNERVGIYSLARYDPAFWGEERGNRYRDLILQRSCKVLAHETAHMFGLRHCIYFACVVNGSNHMAETDAQPQHLCPVCLRKLHHAIGFEPVRRYEQLARFFRRQKWYDDLDWVNRQLTRVKEPVTDAKPDS
jgi:archaemetzincin